MTPPNLLGGVFPLAPTKQALRRTLIAQREALTPAVRAERSKAMVDHLVATIRARATVRQIGLYLPIRGEPDVTGLVAALAGSHLAFSLPVVGASGRTMEFRRWDAGAALTPNRVGIQEPLGGAFTTFAASDLMLVPCLAVDRSGVRLGYGGGFYDAFLPRCAAARIGVVYDELLVTALPHEAHDVRLPRVVTERGVVELVT
jgi:5-formyltetrahydrofolate cyclo-ligase